MKIQNIHIDRHEGSSQYSIGWDAKDGNRYHVWLDLNRRRNSDTLYKNPPRGVEYKGPGYFSTRQLDVTSKANLSTFEFAMQEATRLQLFEKEEEKLTSEKATKDEKNRLEYIEHCKEQAGPVLYEALRTILDEAKFDYKHDKTRAAIAAASAALRTADPK